MLAQMITDHHNGLKLLDKQALTKNSVDGILVSVNQRGNDIHHAQDDEGQQQQRQDRLLRTSN